MRVKNNNSSLYSLDRLLNDLFLKKSKPRFFRYSQKQHPVRFDYFQSNKIIIELPNSFVKFIDIRWASEPF